MIKEFEQYIFKQGLQLLICDRQGIVLESNNVLYSITPGQWLGMLHPYFESVCALLPDLEGKLTMSCVHLDNEEVNRICDIGLQQREEKIWISIHDLTDHYEYYQDVAQARNESVIDSELMLIRNSELEEREKFKDRFIRNFSHELRNPLSSIIAMTQLLARTNLTAEQIRIVEFLASSNENLRLMLEDIISLNLIAVGKLKLSSQKFKLSRLLELLQFTYENKCRAQGIEFQIQCDKRIPDELLGDRLRIFQVLSNLLDNACKYTVAGKVGLHIQFNQQRAGKVYIRFAVRDTGTGIPAASKEKIFQSFERLPQAMKEQGTGLGLAIVRGLLREMGSEIKLHSEEGEGSEFFFDLALPYPLMQDTNQEGSAGEPSIHLSSGERKYRILVVEDNEHILTSLFKSLSGTKQFFINTLTDGAQVMEEIVNNNYDLILMDVNLPNISGEDNTRAIRSLPLKKLSEVPIIGLTANAFPDQLLNYKEAGMNTVLTKPFKDTELLRTIDRVLQRVKKSRT